MPVHDWTRVDADIYHDFHVCWIGEMQSILNNGVLPEGYYVLAEQHAGKGIEDAVALHASTTPDTGGVAVVDAPPKTRRHHTIVQPLGLTHRRSLAVRHVSGHRLVALIEIVSPANKDRREHVEAFTTKVLSALKVGVHVLLVDLFPPGAHDPDGWHGVLLRELEQSDQSYDLPADEPLTLASYAAGPQVDIYLEHAAVGAVLPEMPLFLRPDRYVNVPLESTYLAAYRGMPAFWRDVLEKPSPPAA